MDNIPENSVINRGTPDSNSEDEDENGMDRTLPLSTDFD
jgi:hypothetical protein